MFIIDYVSMENIFEQLNEITKESSIDDIENIKKKLNDFLNEKILKVTREGKYL